MKEIITDVLIVGGGMAAGWAAISAAKTGASVVVVDKGFMGTSGVTAPAGPNHWWVPPDPERREEAVRRRLETAFGLADPEWMKRIIDITWQSIPELDPWYPFSGDGKGGLFRSGLRGPEYLRALRHYAQSLGVTILDHHPVLELLTRTDGAVRGAAGYDRLARHPWRALAGSVVMAAGGCAFRSGLLGSHSNTGDGYLMGIEAGAELSGMEFCVSYSISPAWLSTRTLPYTGARYFNASGQQLDIPGWNKAREYLCSLADAFREGPVYADLHEAPAGLAAIIREIQPATVAAFDRRGVDMFRDRFEVKLFGEGTIRGIGGLRIADATCTTTVPGLFAAGDAATREHIAGASSGGGAQNAAWALSSGVLAGQGAAISAMRQRDDKVVFAALRPKGRVGLRPTGPVRAVNQKSIIKTVQNEMLDLDKSIWRSEKKLTTSQEILDAAWHEIENGLQGKGLDAVAARETAAMVATARWCNAAALARQESRGMHVRTDYPAQRQEFESRLVTTGLEKIIVRSESSVMTEVLA
ncbi:FAD-dependent oxidoreductase [Acetobacter conturbans]|uniref:FAD-binding protein n=1 Tax=Acetobacter conturbans TaxID=1737472 RepID=A0ABX0JZL9_9PROT|nr:FAD-binding protein [Acetobacter conturbans]NHN88844.1 FAD-binding protein [Acetobacter conturbans]